MKRPRLHYLLLTLTLVLAACQDGPVTPDAPASEDPAATDPKLDEPAALEEAEALLGTAAEEVGAGKAGAAWEWGYFTEEQNVFLKSTLALADLEDPDKANATLPLFRGTGPDGDDYYYIITEAASFFVARLLGVNYAPKLIFGRGTGGDQEVTFEGGRIKFKGAIDFSPERVLVAGDGPFAFPPAVAEPGAVADSAWSSVVVLPSGQVLNIQVVANSTGLHDRVISIDQARRTVTLQLLDGFQGGDQYYYHLVTDSSDPVAATIELGVYAPRLAKLPRFGESTVFDESALLGFSPNVNGETGAGNPERQGLNSTIVDGDRDPINVFPLDPDNDQRFFNNYSPLWDAHLNAWTDEAIEAGQRRRITGFEDLSRLVQEGLVVSFEGSPGPENPFVAGLRASNAIINCPVIAQPFEQNSGGPATVLFNQQGR